MAEGRIISADTTASRVVISESQARNFSTYKRMLGEAQAAGVQLEIVSDDDYAALTGKPLDEPPEPDDDGIIADPDGSRYLVVRPADVDNFPRFVAMAEKARQLGAEMRFIDD